MNLAKQLASFSKSINDEYFDLTSFNHFNYGDIRTGKMHRVGEEEFRWNGTDLAVKKGGLDRFY